MFELNKKEYLRYIRQISLHNINMEGQKKLKNSSVLCIGAGGIGSPALYYLAACGVGSIGIVDNDSIELSNLHRQILFNEEDCSKLKSIVAKEKLVALNSDITVTAYPVRLETTNAREMIKEYDIIIDGSDNFETRYLVNDACYMERKRLISASLDSFSGQIMSFDFKNSGSCYRCAYPQPPEKNSIKNCQQAGILGVVPGMLGTMAANEALKLILGIGSHLISSLLMVDTFNNQFNKYQIEKNSDCVLCGKKISAKQLPQNQATRCNSKLNHNSISAKDLFLLIEKSATIKLLDVRSITEREFTLLANSFHCPLDELERMPLPFDKNDHIVIYCRSGLRSLQGVTILQQLGYCHVESLTGGILAMLNHLWLQDKNMANN